MEHSPSQASMPLLHLATHSVVFGPPSLFQTKLTQTVLTCGCRPRYPFLLLMIPLIGAIQWLTADKLCIWRYVHNANPSLWPVLVGQLDSRTSSLGELQLPCLSSCYRMPNFPPQLSSPLDGAEQGGSRLIVEGDDETGGRQVSVIAYRGAPAAQESTSVSQTLPSSSHHSSAPGISQKRVIC